MRLRYGPPSREAIAYLETSFLYSRPIVRVPGMNAPRGGEDLTLLSMWLGNDLALKRLITLPKRGGTSLWAGHTKKRLYTMQGGLSYGK
jgi:hypothetical protein